ncbi:MAG: tRNA (cytidine(34)-2'-O)-methyltransferase [Deltaproteobacteria bacterium]|nr:tRNA (cytidine(34)-2'-O)-methyltransferase [Deltaproteobacteria bacterium]
MKLRLKRPTAGFNVVLVEPEIPQNTGNIGRLCVATSSTLHLVGPLGFEVDEKAVRRAGLDYWHLVDVRRHADLAQCLSAAGVRETLVFTANTGRSYLEAPYAPGAALVFGGESRGLAESVLDAHRDRLYAIPTCESSVRSLNLANAAAIVLYEALRACGLLADLEVEP